MKKKNKIAVVGCLASLASIVLCCMHLTPAAFGGIPAVAGIFGAAISAMNLIEQ